MWPSACHSSPFAKTLSACCSLAVSGAVRVLAGVWVGAGILGDRKVRRDFWLIPLRDLFGFAVWAAGIFGDTVQWRDRQLKLRPDGRIVDDIVGD